MKNVLLSSIEALVFGCGWRIVHRIRCGGEFGELITDESGGTSTSGELYAAFAALWSASTSKRLAWVLARLNACD